MEFSESVIEGLKHAFNKELFSDEVFKQFLNDSYSFIVGKKADTDLIIDPNYADVNQGLLKAIIISFSSILIESAKFDLSRESLSALLEEYQLDESRVSDFCQMFISHKKNLRTNLSLIGSQFPHIVDVEWSLDYFIKSDDSKVNEVLYTLCLHTESSDVDAVKKTQFSCSREQLQDLVSNLKDACKNLEKLTVT